MYASGTNRTCRSDPMTPAVEGILLQKSKIEQPYGRRDAAAGAARLAALAIEE